MAESENNNLRELSPEQLRQLGPTIEKACRDAGVTNGKNILVMVDDGGYVYRYEGESNAEGEKIPDCPSELCRELERTIGEYCHSHYWPPNEPIIIMQPDGQLCYCYCR